MFMIPSFCPLIYKHLSIKSPLPPLLITNNCYVVQHLLIVYNILMMLFNDIIEKNRRSELNSLFDNFNQIINI